MYIVIAGGGAVGQSLARALIAHKHDVVVVDQDRGVCEGIAARTGALVRLGNATDIEVLEEAGLNKADVAVAATPHDADNLAFGVLARYFGVPRVMAANPPAARLGIAPGMALADARALFPALETRQANPVRDHRGLTRLADWCGRYSPLIALDGADGLMIDITGCDHLFGGEAAMLASLTARIEGFGYSTAAAIAPTPGAAWALARYAENGTIAAAAYATDCAE